MSLSVVDGGPIAPGDQAEDAADGKTIGQSFPGKQTGLLCLRRLMSQAPEIHAGGKCAQRGHTGVGESVEVLLIGCVDVDQRCHGVVVAADQHACCRGQRKQPFRIPWPNA